MIDKIKSKIYNQTTIVPCVEEWKKQNLKIVFTNGCFDLLHYGHIHYLGEARGLGDKLILGLNADTSVRRIKGNHRPIKDEQSRLLILAALECIDAVILFSEDTPLQLVKLICPQVIVKGGDWQPKDIVGADIVLENGGEVKSLPFIEGYSTSKLEEKIRSSNIPPK